ncbi:MAG: hypothetical protein V3V09_07375 [Arenicellales bacterium]
MNQAEAREWLRSGDYSLVYAAEVTPKNADDTLDIFTHEFFLQGGKLRLATEYVNAGDYVYYGTMSKILGASSKLPSNLIGNPPQGTGSVTMQIVGDELPAWLADMRLVDFEGADIVIRAGKRGQKFEDMLLVHTGTVSNPRLTDNSHRIEFRLGGRINALTSDVYSVPTVDIGCTFAHQKIYGKCARVNTRPFDGGGDIEFYYADQLITLDKVYLNGYESTAYTQPSACRVKMNGSAAWTETKKIEVDCTFASSQAAEVIGNAIYDSTALPYENFTVDSLDYLEGITYQCGAVLARNDTGKIYTKTWADFLDLMVGGTGGTWQFDRHGSIRLLHLYKELYSYSPDVLSTLRLNDYVSVDSSAIPKFGKVTVKIEKTNAPDEMWAVLGGASGGTEGAQRELTAGETKYNQADLTLVSPITNEAHGQQLTDLIKAGRYQRVYGFKGCLTGMTYDVGDELVIDHDVDGYLKRGRKVVVLEANITKDQLFKVAA